MGKVKGVQIQVESSVTGSPPLGVFRKAGSKVLVGSSLDSLAKVLEGMVDVNGRPQDGVRMA